MFERQKTGQPGKADAALNAIGTLNFVDCGRLRGTIGAPTALRYVAPLV